MSKNLAWEQASSYTERLDENLCPFFYEHGRLNNFYCEVCCALYQYWGKEDNDLGVYAEFTSTETEDGCKLDTTVFVSNETSEVKAHKLLEKYSPWNVVLLMAQK